MAAAGDLARLYAVDGVELKRGLLVKAHAAAVTALGAVKGVMRMAAWRRREEAVAVDAFDAVGQLAALAEAAANKTRQVKVVAGIQSKLAELRGLVEEFGRVKKAFGKLEREPADAEAHLVIGRFYAISKGQWELGLVHLAAGSDTELSVLTARGAGQTGRRAGAGGGRGCVVGLCGENERGGGGAGEDQRAGACAGVV